MVRPLTLDIFRAIAQERGGECLSSEYINVKQRMRFRCAKGHEWETTALNVRVGHWCPLCPIKRPTRHTLEEMRALARKRGGECLSSEYVRIFSPLRWRCAQGHEWQVSPASVIKGHWCRVCGGRAANKNRELGLAVAQQMAEERGGECLSTVYPPGQPKVLRWRCADGHEWEMSLRAVRHSGQWCPVCASGLAERFCRAMFERVFDAPFPKARPKWLRNSRGKQMELDGYNADLRLAFEFHGVQHYKDIAFFHEKSSLVRRMEDDDAKLALCAEHGVTLLVVPYTVSFEGLQHYIYQECAFRGVAVERKASIDIDKLDYYPSKDLERMRRFAEGKGGKCLAESFQGVLAPVWWECEHGHRWQVSFRGLYHDETWCPVCAGNLPRTLEEMRSIARERGGESLSAEYKNVNSKMRWRCSKGHEWLATPRDVIHSHSWCPKCAGVAPLSLEDAREAASTRGGECLSTEYINNRTKMRWRCDKGHEWLASLGEIKSGNWCAVCSRKAKLTIEEMQAIAKERGGECLSREYINLNTKLHWRCALGHEWWAVPDNVKHRSAWCPTCAKTMQRHRRTASA